MTDRKNPFFFLMQAIARFHSFSSCQPLQQLYFGQLHLLVLPGGLKEEKKGFFLQPHAASKAQQPAVFPELAIRGFLSSGFFKSR